MSGATHSPPLAQVCAQTATEQSGPDHPRSQLIQSELGRCGRNEVCSTEDSRASVRVRAVAVVETGLLANGNAAIMARPSLSAFAHSRGQACPIVETPSNNVVDANLVGRAPEESSRHVNALVIVDDPGPVALIGVLHAGTIDDLAIAVSLELDDANSVHPVGPRGRPNSIHRVTYVRVDKRYVRDDVAI